MNINFEDPPLNNSFSHVEIGLYYNYCIELQSHQPHYCILIEIQNALFDLIDRDAVRTEAYGPTYGPGNALTQ